MSKFLPDPQIQSLKAMRAGDIAFGQGGTLAVGKQSVAIAQPIINLNRSVTAVPGTEPVSGPFNEAPVIGEAIQTLLSVDVAQSVAPVAAESTVTVDGPFNESPVIGVAVGTSVI